ncbi:hypothetical protein [Williamsia sterculiae]|uniref:Uncharacterized protein n=1 Tax=Williamsia sterculiae TaxID=1344003 RepID=A0A1N7EPF8_9NOCA|nr:hypothetical protein [Williamsia sterculiae]SIR89919.1 hypothetical protein SAMN05445060_1525 [Williamsia sterculiae]
MSDVDARLRVIARDLYAGDPAEFVDVRTARVAQARAAGDRELGTALGRLRRPTQVARLVNLLARERPDDVAALLDLGIELTEAQRRLSGDRMRELARRRSAVVGALARAAVALGTDHGITASDGAVREISQTLHAALADPATAALVRDARLSSAVHYDGLGPAGLTLAGAGPATDGPGEDRARTAADERTGLAEEYAAAQRRLDGATSAMTDAEAAARDTEVAAGELTSERDRRRADVERLRDELQVSEDELRGVEQRLQFATASARAAAAELAAAHDDLEAARSAVRALRSRPDGAPES